MPRARIEPHRRRERAFITALRRLEETAISYATKFTAVPPDHDHIMLWREQLAYYAMEYADAMRKMR